MVEFEQFGDTSFINSRLVYFFSIGLPDLAHKNAGLNLNFNVNKIVQQTIF